MIREHEIRGASAPRAPRRMPSAAADRRDPAGSSPSSPYTCASAERAEPIAARAQIDQPQRGVAADPCAAAASACVRTSPTGANADTISDTGATTLFVPLALAATWSSSTANPCPPESRCPSAGHSSSPTARTVAYSAASSPGSPHAAIQFADSRISIERRDVRGENVRDRLRPPPGAPTRAHPAPRAACARPSPSLRRRGRV